MTKKKLEIRNKLINHITLNGEKKTSEKILLKSFKTLQKYSTKQTNEILKLAIINSTSTFKLHKISNKKRKKKNRKVREIPSFISKPDFRTSLSLRFILYSMSKRKSSNFYFKFKEEILLAAKAKSNSVLIKTELQKQILVNKRFFRYYRW
jgi:ribosomal protein S7